MDVEISPHSIESENAVLGAIFKNHKIIDDIAEILKPENFYNVKNHKVFKTILDLYKDGETIDFITVLHKLNDPNISADFLVSYTDSIAVPQNAVSYANIVLEKSRKRDYINAAYNVISMMQTENVEQTESPFDKSQYLFMTLADKISKDDTVSAKEAMEDLRETIINDEELFSGFSTGYTDLDNIINGFKHADLHVLAARPSMGKTALALNMLINAAKKNVPGLFFSFEMKQKKLNTRILFSQAAIEREKFVKKRLTYDEKQKLIETTKEVGKLPYHVDDTAYNELDIRTKARKAKSKHDIQFIIVDYLQLVKCSEKKDTREQEVSHVTASLVRLGKELNIAVLALAQLNRKLDDRTDKRPILSDLRESGSIEQDSDVIMFLYRDAVYSGNDCPKQNTAEIIVRKNREGKIGTTNLTFFEKTGRFENQYRDLK